MIDSGEITGRLKAASASLDGLAAAVAGNRLGADAVEALLAEVRLVQRRAVGVVAALTAAALANSREGSGPVPEDVLGRGGTVGRQETRAEIERARVAARFPEVAAGVAAGSVHTGNVDVLARLTSRMDDDELDVLAERDTDLAAAAGRLGEESFRKRVQRMRDKMRDDHGAEAAQQAVDDSFARVSLGRDKSSYRLAGQLDPLRGAAVQAAVAREFRWLSKQPALVEGLDADQAMAQALHDLIMRGDSLDRDDAVRAGGPPRANVTVLVLTDRQTLQSGAHSRTVAETDDGCVLNPQTVGRLCCDSRLRRIDELPDAEVAVSHSGRTATPAQRAALRAMYDGCAISGAPWSQCETHHVVHYQDSGRTVLSELVPISRRWHHLVHEGGWTLTMDGERTLTLSRPDGTVHRTIPYAQTRPPSGDSDGDSRGDHTLAA